MVAMRQPAPSRQLDLGMWLDKAQEKQRIRIGDYRPQGMYVPVHLLSLAPLEKMYDPSSFPPTRRLPRDVRRFILFCS